MSDTERIVEVLWEDSASTCDWAEEREILTLKPGVIRTVGYVHEDSKAMLRLLSDIPVEDDGGTKGRVLAIPRSAIRKVTELKHRWPIAGMSTSARSQGRRRPPPGHSEIRYFDGTHCLILDCEQHERQGYYHRGGQQCEGFWHRLKCGRW